MASPEVLDFARLVEPIPGEDPAGADLRRDLAPDSIYRRLRAARIQAREAERREAERRIAHEEDDPQPTERNEPPDWRPILQLAPKALAEQSKDLEIAGLLIEALIREHGYAGLRDGFRLARELVERFWDDLYPPPEEEGVLDRVAPLTGLNGDEGNGLLIAPIGRAPITAPGSVGPLSVSDYNQACELQRIQDPDKRNRRLSQPGVVTTEMFDEAVSQTPAEWFENLLEDMAQCSEEFERLCTLLEEKCGQDESGHSLAPPSSAISSALQECRDTVSSISRHLLAPTAEEGEEVLAENQAGALQTAATGGASGPVQTREEAFRALLRAADFFKRTEPHSPVSYALEQAVRWGRMELPELLVELLPDPMAREQLFKLVGIKTPEDS